MVAPDTTVYLVVSGVLGLIWVALLPTIARSAGGQRRMAAIASVPVIAMGGAYLLMHLEVWTYETAGREQSVTRFFGYSAAVLSFTYIIREAVSLSAKRTILVAGFILATLWTQLISWFLTGALESLVTAIGLGFFVGVCYLLYGPLNAHARECSGERRLLFVKLRNLFVLCYGALILTSAASEQVLGLLTPFVSSVGAGYIDLVLMAGISLLTLSSLSIFAAEETAEPADVTFSSQENAEG